MFHQIRAWSIESLFEHDAHPHPGRYRQKDQQGGAPLVQQEQIADNRQGKQERHTTPPKTVKSRPISSTQLGPRGSE